jgi:hypothetical protein
VGGRRASENETYWQGEGRIVQRGYVVVHTEKEKRGTRGEHFVVVEDS